MAGCDRLGRGLGRYAQEPWLQDGKLAWRAGRKESGDREVLRPAKSVRAPKAASGC
jgi:phosphogluconate dehydratase